MAVMLSDEWSLHRQDEPETNDAPRFPLWTPERAEVFIPGMGDEWDADGDYTAGDR